MSMTINHNIASLNTYRQLTVNDTNTAKNIEKLSSGLRINRAGDDAAGLAISEKMRGQIRGLDMATKNSQDGISLIQTAEGALNETQSILQRMRELSVQSSNDTNTDSDRGEIQKEMDQLVKEIDRISDTTEFNTKKLLNGNLSGVENSAQSVAFDENNSAVFTAIAGTTNIANDQTYNVKISGYSSANGYTVSWTAADGTTGSATVAAAGGAVTIGSDAAITFGALTISNIGDQATFTTRVAQSNTNDNSLNYQIGANSSQTMSVSIGDMSSTALHVNGIDVTTASGAEAAISAVNKAVEDVSSQRAKLGAFQNRLEHTVNNLGAASENLTAAESRIRDVDMAKEMTQYTKNNILSQAAQAMLAQANQQPQGVLQLLR